MTTLEESSIHAQTESPCHAFVASGGPIEFWAVWARGVSTVPAFCKYSCTGPGADGLTDVENYYKFCQSLTWNITDISTGTYQQTESLDANTFEPATVTIDINTWTGGGSFGSP